MLVPLQLFVGGDRRGDITKPIRLRKTPFPFSIVRTEKTNCDVIRGHVRDHLIKSTQVNVRPIGVSLAARWPF